MFKKIEIKERDLYYKFLDKNKFISCEYSFSTLYMWKKANLLQYKIINNIFVIKKYDLDYGMFFMEPLGEYSDEELLNLLLKLEEIRKKSEMSWLLGNLSKKFVERIEKILGDDIIIEEEKNHFDYIYESNKLIELKGKEYRNKRNKINQFVKSYEHEINIVEKNLNKNDILKYRKFLERWNEENSNKEDLKNDIYYKYELESIEELLKYLVELNIKLIELYSKNELIGFSIGEVFNEYTYIVHVEKCLKDYNGAYAFINNMALKLCHNGVKYVNREEDLGIEGLRKAKMSYNPIFIEKKYLINFK